MTPFRMDHVVIRVGDLAAAIGDYERLGFTVVPGGEHPGFGSQNALIALADDSYIELIAYQLSSALRAPNWQPRTATERRLTRWVEAPAGLVDVALLPADIAAATAAAQQRGLAIAEPVPGQRLRPDGQRVAWEVAFPDTFDVPFLCADVTPRPLRVPPGAARRHANGVTALASLTLAVADLPRSTRRLCALLGTEPQPLASAAMPLSRAFALPTTTLILAAPTDPASPLAIYLATRGDGPFSVTLRAPADHRAAPLDLTLAHGARLELAP